MRVTIKGILRGVLLIFTVLFLSCAGSTESMPERDFREDMRQFVIALSEYGKSSHPGFLVIPQNGQELITLNGSPEGPVHRNYGTAIDGTGREDLFYGYSGDNRSTPEKEREYLLDYCTLFEQEGLSVLVTDYCEDPEKMDDSYQRNRASGFLSFAAPDRNLRVIPAYPSPVFQENAADILSLADARNFLYLINGEHYPDRRSLIAALGDSNYDLLILDLFQSDQIWTPEDVAALKVKNKGGQRLVVCYMSIGEAEDYRYYWQEEWKKNPPGWMEEENPSWEGNYKVRYWDPEWQSLMFGRKDSYLDKILAAGFDGVYLDIIDAFEYFED